jgi:hypothetical protein
MAGKEKNGGLEVAGGLETAQEGTHVDLESPREAY